MANKHKHRLSKISGLHYIKLVGRSLLLLGTLVLYIVTRVQGREFSLSFANADILSMLFLGFIWIIFAVEMILRFFPSKHESMGCQKQFKKNFIPTKNKKPVLHSWKVTFWMTAAWLGLNAVFGVLYHLDIIDSGIMMIIALAYSVCDMICILFFCPFQTWFMKNKCCGSCRIYNWDFAMMFTPFAFVMTPYTWSLLGISLALLLVWEIYVHKRPERFSEATNAVLSCANCKEKLCQHKGQLRQFLKDNRNNLVLNGNTSVEEDLRQPAHKE